MSLSNNKKPKKNAKKTPPASTSKSTKKRTQAARSKSTTKRTQAKKPAARRTRAATSKPAKKPTAAAGSKQTAKRTSPNAPKQTKTPKATKRSKKQDPLKHDEKFEMGTDNRPITFNINGRQRQIQPPTPPAKKYVAIESIRVHYKFKD